MAVTIAAMMKITDKVTAINQIADQTNLLALNAAIEARAPDIRDEASPSWPEEVRRLADGVPQDGG